MNYSVTKRLLPTFRLTATALTLLLLFITCASTVFAQQDLATLTGTVADTNGAVVPNATVTVRSTAQGIERTATASDEGVYSIPQLRPGVYSVTVTASGFGEATGDNIEIGVGQTRTFDVALTAGGQSVSIDVVGGTEAATIDTSSNRLGVNVTAREVQELPVNGRNYSQLYLLTPGATNNGAGNFGDLRFNGRANQQNQSKLDGIENSAIFDASPGYVTVQGSQFRLQTSLENIQEFRVDSSNYPAEFGTGTGGQINIVGKSGANDFNGSLFNYLRNDIFDARNFFDGPNKSKLRLNQFGGSIGGRIIRDRLFFFGSYEGLRQRAGFPSLDELTLSPVARDFVNFYGTTDPRGEAARALLNIPVATATAAQPRIQNLRAVGLINAFPVGNIPFVLGATPSINNATQGIRTNSVAALNEDAISFRMDANIDEGGRFRLFSRYQRNRGDLRSPDGTTGRFIVATQEPDNFVTSLTQVYGANIVNETRIGFNRSPTTLGTEIPTATGINNLDLTASSISLTGNFVNPGVNGAAATGFAVPGGLTRQSSAGNGRAQPINARTFTAVDNISIVKGNHLSKFGFEFRNIFVDFDQLGGTTYSYSSVTDFLLNQTLSANFIGDLSAPGNIRIATNPITIIERPESGFHRGRQYYLIGYGQDEWKIRPNFTINYGLRYEYYSPNRERDNRVITFDRGTLSLRPRDEDFYTAKKTNFAPRLAFTYAPARFNNKTVFRVGGGLYYGPGQYEDLIQPIESDVFRTTASFGGGIDGNTFNQLANPAANAQPLPFQARSYDVQGYQVPERVGQYGASIQQQLPGNTVLTVGYVGSQGRNLFQRGVANRIRLGNAEYVGTSSTAIPALNAGIINRIGANGLVDSVITNRETTLLNFGYDAAAAQVVARSGSVVQSFAEQDFKTSGGRDSYNALQTTINRRFTAGLTLGGQYTWAHSIGTTQGSNEANTAQNPYSFAEERGNNTNDIRHSANFSALYELPIGESRFLNLGSVGNAIFNGLQIGGIYNGRSGLPLDLRIVRPDVVIQCAQAGGCPVNTVVQNGQVVAAPNTAFIPQGTVASLPTVSSTSPLPPGFRAVVNTPGGNASRSTRRPDIVSGVNPYLNDSGLNFLNPAAFTTPQPGTYGNLSRNALYGPTFHQFDLTLQKRFRLTEGTNIEFRTEVYNILNKANFANPPINLTSALPNITFNSTTGVISGVAANGTPSSGLQPGQAYSLERVPTFGRIGTTVGRTVGLGTNRQLQFALRLNF